MAYFAGNLRNVSKITASLLTFSPKSVLLSLVYWLIGQLINIGNLPMEVAIMDGILEKFMRDAAQNPERPMYDFMDCGSEPYVHHYITIGEA